jgi:phosphatidylinositol phospholipase C, delta
MKSEIGKNERLALFCGRLDHLQQGLRLVRLLDMKGKDSGATLLVRFSISLAE